MAAEYGIRPSKIVFADNELSFTEAQMFDLFIFASGKQIEARRLKNNG